MAPPAASAPQPIGDHADRAIVEAGERLVEQHQPRAVQQRALEREPLAHAAREAADRIVAAIREPAPRRAPSPTSAPDRDRTARRRTSGSAAPRARDTGTARARAGRCARADRGPAWPPSRCRSGSRLSTATPASRACAISVDLPAPFGPSSPTMSPGCAVKETLASARRRPKWRETSRSWTESKSTLTLTRRRRRGRQGQDRRRRSRARCRSARARSPAPRAAPP